MIQFFAPDIERTLQLPESDSRHAVRVLRLSEGERIQVIDGRGHLFICRIVEAHPKHAGIEIMDRVDSPLTWRQNLTMAVAPTKHMDRMEWMVEKMTEIGVNRIIPLLCERSERREIKTERLEKIAVSAMKQSLKATLPVISPITPLGDILTMMPGATRMVAYCDRSIPRVDITGAYIPGRDTIILIGPEGDFSPAEINETLGAGFAPVTLGDNRLRTETAGIYALSACHLLDQALLSVTDCSR